MNAPHPKSYTVDPAEALVKALVAKRRRARQKVVVDLFCGTGGSSEGVCQALDYGPVLAVNHSPNAIAVHTANHPDTVHLQRSVYEVPAWKMFTRGVVDLLCASPDCTHHSRAKGCKPLDKGIRDLAWVVSEWAREAAPKVILVENVAEFQDWGPLYPADHPVVKLRNRPIPERRGETFRAWVQSLRLSGYLVEWRVLAACDYGAPTSRARLFVQASCDGKPIEWPEPTHAAPRKVKRLGLKPWRSAAECIDWSIPCHTIFMDREQARDYHRETGHRVKRPLAENTLRRIAAGVVKYVVEAEQPFLVNLTHGGRVEGIDEPVKTITGAHRGEKAVVVPVISKAHGNGWDRGAGPSRAADEPMPTLTGTEQYIVAGANITRIGQTGGGGDYVNSVEQPLTTVVSKAEHFVVESVVAPCMVTNTTGNPPSGAGEPVKTITGAGNQILVAASLVQAGYGEREGQAPRSLDIGAPLGTVVSGGVKHALVSALLAKHNGTTDGKRNDGQDLREPAPTVTSKAPMGPVACHLAQLYGSAEAGRGIDQPAPTVSSSGGRGGGHTVLVETCLSEADAERLAGTNAEKVYAFITKYYGEGSFGSGLAEPLHTIVGKARMGLVLVYICGEPWVITDIRIRMLTPRELATAQGFPSDYILGVESSTKGDEIEGIGNSVSPPVMEALVRTAMQPARRTSSRRAAA